MTIRDDLIDFLKSKKIEVDETSFGAASTDRVYVLPDSYDLGGEVAGQILELVVAVDTGHDVLAFAEKIWRLFDDNETFTPVAYATRIGTVAVPARELEVTDNIDITIQSNMRL